MVTIDVKNPRTGLVDHRLPGLDSAGVMAVAARLRVAQPGWAARPLATRLAALGRLADALDSHADAIVAALEADTGRRHISRVEVMGVKGMIARWQRDAGPLIAGVEETLTPTALPGVMAATRLHPYPLVGIISPWNFPLTLAMIDAVPALAAGCAVMIKPSEIAPRFIAPLRAAIADVPELADVLALIEGDGGTGAALVGAVDYVAFTGSVATGRRVAAAAAAAFIPASLELGGKDPMIVLASADPDWAAGVALRASVLATGQACQSIERVYVDRAIAGPFLEALVAAAEAVTLNWPDVGTGDLGPFIDGRQATVVQAQIDDAVAQGARVLAGGRVEDHGGLWLRPTVLVDVTPEMKVMADETFGPVIPVTLFDSVDEAVALANGGDFGLSAAVLAGSIAEAEAVGVRLRAGAVSLNDGSLTSMIGEAEKSSFGLSGLGPSRMGASGLLRFFRRQALLRQSGTAMPLGAWAERG
ncbi:acyl-CoA reductase-like NAD-dependent aldehyde dehydrogenase [Polymorphobacter multimanifer]|uniref:Acyl-CoA reductase-like NAD-dependent aldehyde dehydrogenase n=1 Tax=Polymorphobacter multimanifer TaxID=1070431 RepID=A0A841L6Y4_9SPHN|nr:aldehyde dehydrogenase family protein [Polymorphobacter multimanifer]MBB6228739.1 acyl-CoA reductase-like NAD-dependent aldehyde dehydrogenase [Polymorphobacter multimanifer]